MKSTTKQSNKRAAFTIVELLTVMSIIVILIGLLVPALNQVKRFAYEVKQKAQLSGIDKALELFNSEFDGYPDSSALGPDGVEYCGAMKLCEAVMGQDLLGFHPDSTFRSDGTDGIRALYPDSSSMTPQEYRANLSTRKGPYLPLDNANAFSMGDLYGTAAAAPFLPRHFVLCDVYRRVTHKTIGNKVGMPILYYRANTANTRHNVNQPDDPQNIYNYRDNQTLLLLGKPWDMGNAANQGTPNSGTHRLAIENGTPGLRFYMNTKNEKVLTVSRPYRSDSYILISAGWDGEYGTPDDVCNYDWRYQEIP